MLETSAVVMVSTVFRCGGAGSPRAASTDTSTSRDNSPRYLPEKYFSYVKDPKILEMVLIATADQKLFLFNGLLYIIPRWSQG